jgi:hypothetical protein
VFEQALAWHGYCGEENQERQGKARGTLGGIVAKFEVGQAVTIHHLKPWRKGRPVQMRGWVKSFDGSLLVVRRQFRSPGQPYDGLDAVQKPGDHGTIEVHAGGWVSRRRYLRANGHLIGELYNIQTPAEFLPDIVRYIDLEIDVGLHPGQRERVLIQDARELEEAEARGYIPGGVAAVARQLAGELAERLRQESASEEPSWDVRPDPGQVTAEMKTFFTRR